jgi:hypothetical protein
MPPISSECDRLLPSLWAVLQGAREMGRWFAPCFATFAPVP